MSVKMIQLVEKEIVGAFVKDALKAGHRLSVSLERGYDLYDPLCVLGSKDYNKIMEEAFAGDECHIFVHSAEGNVVEDGVVNSIGWIYVVYGNDGYDVISDYTINLEPLLKRANELSDFYGG